MLPIVAALAAKGLSMIGDAILAKGKDVVEKTLGVTIPEDGNLTNEQVLLLKEAELKNSQWLAQIAVEQRKAELEADINEENNVTQRQAIDMTSESWLAKNVRPMTLVYILSAYLILSLLDGIGFHVTEAYVKLLGDWGMLVMSFYFGGRTIEKIIALKSGGG